MAKRPRDGRGNRDRSRRLRAGLGDRIGDRVAAGFGGCDAGAGQFQLGNCIFDVPHAAGLVREKSRSSPDADLGGFYLQDEKPDGDPQTSDGIFVFDGPSPRVDVRPGDKVRVDGKVHTAAGGTLFLDEIGEMPLELQGKLLRFLQERRFERVGGRDTLESDARIVVATNRDLADMVKRGTFRSDLYYRVRVIEVELPPLRQWRSYVVLMGLWYF